MNFNGKNRQILLDRVLKGLVDALQRDIGDQTIDNIDIINIIASFSKTVMASAISSSDDTVNSQNVHKSQRYKDLSVTIGMIIAGALDDKCDITMYESAARTN